MRTRIEVAAVLLVGAVVALTACGDDRQAGQKSEPIEKAEAPLPAFELESELPPSVREAVLKPFTGDLDELVKRRVVRIGVTYNRTFYFVDKGVQRGIAYEYGQLMQARLNKRFKAGTSNRIHVIFLPLPREMLPAALVDGKVDLVAAQVPVTPELKKYVEFSDPTRTNVNQILVTGPGAPAIASIEDLPGREVFARKLGGYHQSLLALNETFKAQDRQLVDKAQKGFMAGALLGHYNAIADRPVCVDKSRIWLLYYEWLASFWPNPKVIVCVRDIRAILSSMEKLYRRSRENGPAPNENLGPGMLNMVGVTNRVGTWMNSNPVGLGAD